jgi:hypothetical protein
MVTYDVSLVHVMYKAGHVSTPIQLGTITGADNDEVYRKAQEILADWGRPIMRNDIFILKGEDNTGFMGKVLSVKVEEDCLV